MLSLKISHFTSKKMGLFGNSRKLKFGTSQLQQNCRQVQQATRRGTFYLMEKEEEIGWGCFESKSHWRKAGVEGDDSFSLAELSRLWISCRRFNVHLFLIGPVVNSFLLTVLMRSIIDSLPVIGVEWYLPRTLSGLTTPL